MVIPAIRDRAALGGGITLGLVLTFDAEGDAFRFLNITVALLVVLVALYLRFRPGRQEASKVAPENSEPRLLFVLLLASPV